MRGSITLVASIVVWLACLLKV